MPSLAQRVFAEGLGTAFLLAAVVGSGIMAQRLAGGNDALALLCNTIPTGAILAVLILTFGKISGAHFNPAVTAVRAIFCASAICTGVIFAATLSRAFAASWSPLSAAKLSHMCAVTESCGTPGCGIYVLLGFRCRPRLNGRAG
jgi:glycerol uptake facilitator-like aquaporin